MLVQSGGGKVYAILADNDEYEVGILPQLALQSTTVFLSLRLRFKSRKSDYFDPMLAPKWVMCGGIERSKNTLRGTIMMNTGFTLEKVGGGFPEIIAKRVAENSLDTLLPGVAPEETYDQVEKVALYYSNIREDFVEDFGKLLSAAIEPVYPPKDFSQTPTLMTGFDFMMAVESAAEKQPSSAFQTLDGGKASDPNSDFGPGVTKFPFGNQGVDKGDDGEPENTSGKMKVFGKAPDDEDDDPPTAS